MIHPEDAFPPRPRLAALVTFDGVDIADVGMDGSTRIDWAAVRRAASIPIVTERATLLPPPRDTIVCGIARLLEAAFAAGGKAQRALAEASK